MFNLYFYRKTNFKKNNMIIYEIYIFFYIYLEVNVANIFVLRSFLYNIRLLGIIMFIVEYNTI